MRIAPDQQISKISLTQAPTAEAIDSLAKEYSAAGVLSIWIDYDYFPTSVGALDLSYLSKFPQTTALTLRAVAGLRSLEFLRQLPELRQLTIGQTKTSRLDLSPIGVLTQLEQLRLDKQQHEIESLSDLTRLKYLSLQSTTLRTLHFCGGLTALRGLRLALGGTRDLSPLGAMKLRYLELWQIRGLKDEDLLPISEMSELRYLFLDRLKDISRMPDFSRCERLSVVHLEGLSSLSELSNLGSAPELEEIKISGTKRLRPADFAILRSHPKLRKGFIGTGTDRDNKEVEKILPLEPGTPVPQLFERAMST